MRIGLVLSSTPGYSETFLTSKIKGLQEQGIDVVLFSQQIDKEFKLCTVIKSPRVYKRKVFQILAMLFQLVRLIPHYATLKRYVILEKKHNTSFSNILKKTYLNSHILSQQLDWLHFGFATQALGSEMVAKAIGAKMGVSFRGFDIAIYPFKHTGCYDSLWKMVDKVHTISDDLLKKAYQLGLSKETYHQKITPAIDISVFQESNKKFHIPETKIHFLTITRLHWKKGIIPMLEALSKFKDQGYDFIYKIVGEGKEYERIAFAISQLGLDDKVLLVGKKERKEVVKLYEEAHVYLQYSISEGFCNAVIEAQSMGLLCVVSDAEGLSENVANNETGWVIPRFHVKELENKIIEVINFKESEKKQVSLNAQERVQKFFTIEQQQKQFVDFYLR